jgi:hypothetical protein
MSKCDCYIGVWYDWENSDIVTLSDLKEHIKDTNNLIDFREKMKIPLSNSKKVSLSDYCDKRRTNNLTRFDYCPFCGKKIDWKSIKESENNT